MWHDSSNLSESGWPTEHSSQGPGYGPLTRLGGTIQCGTGLELQKKMPSPSEESQLPWRRTGLDENFRFAHRKGEIWFETSFQDVICEKEMIQEEIAETLRAKHLIRVYLKDDGTVAAKFVHVLSDLQKCYRESLPYWHPVWKIPDSYNLFIEGLCAHHIRGNCSHSRDANFTCKFVHKDLDEISEVLIELIETELLDGVEEQLSDAASSFVAPVATEACDAAVQMHMAGSHEEQDSSVMCFQ
eukprot:Skav206613  [mRNA]  locus=scaffold1562:92249:93123:+ [translate_table: standard]